MRQDKTEKEQAFLVIREYACYCALSCAPSSPKKKLIFFIHSMTKWGKICSSWFLINISFECIIFWRVFFSDCNITLRRTELHEKSHFSFLHEFRQFQFKFFLSHSFTHSTWNILFYQWVFFASHKLYKQTRQSLLENYWN